MADKRRSEREVDLGWQYATVVNAKTNRTKCNLCGKEMGGGIHRLKLHLAGKRGDVQPCSKANDQIRALFREQLASKKKEIEHMKARKEQVMDEIRGHATYGTGPDIRAPGLVNSDDNSDGSDVEFRAAMRQSMQSIHDDEMRRRGMGTSTSGTDYPRSKSFRVPQSSGSQPLLPHTMSVNQRSNLLGSGGDLTGVSDPSIGPMDHYVLRKDDARQTSIKTALRGWKQVKKVASHQWRHIGKWFFYSNIPANATDNPYYETMVDSIARGGLGVPPPKPKDIYGPLLDEEVRELQAWIDSFKKVWDERGCTLMCDGWTGTTRKSMINFLVYCPHGTVFLKSFDVSDDMKTSEFICELMDQMVEQVGEDRVVQVVTDNAANYKRAGQLLMERRRHLYWIPCAAHCLDLMLEDIGTDSGVNSVIHDAQTVSGYIYSHQRILAMFRQVTGDQNIVRPGPTRFATQFLSLESLYKHRVAIRDVFKKKEYLKHFKVLSNKSKNLGKSIHELVERQSFWENIQRYLRLVEPIVQVLRMVDGDDKNDMGYLYEAMDRAKERVQKRFPTTYTKWWAIIDARWEGTLHHELHAAGYFLNPRYQYSANVHNDSEVIHGLLNVIARISTNDEMRFAAESQLEDYRLRMGVYGLSELQSSVMKYSPADWWAAVRRRSMGINALAEIAIRVLSQTTAASECERNWSTFSLVHTKLRNRLKVERLEKLVFCHYNMRLRMKNQERQHKLLQKKLAESEGVDPEDVQVEGQIDLDELFHEEHPLNAWVETRTELDQPVFDPECRDWAEGELDDVTLSPEFQQGPSYQVAARVSVDEPFIPHRQSASQPYVSIPEFQPPRMSESAIHTTSKGKGKEKLKQYKRKSVIREEEDSPRRVRSDDTTQAPAGINVHDDAPFGAGHTQGFTAPRFSLGMGSRGGGGGDSREEDDPCIGPTQYGGGGPAYWELQASDSKEEEILRSFGGGPHPYWQQQYNIIEQGQTEKPTENFLGQWDQMASSLFGYGYQPYMQQPSTQHGEESGDGRDAREGQGSSSYPYGSYRYY